MPRDPRTPRSGNPAKQAQIDLTVKRQREAARQEKLAEYHRELSRRKRSRIVWWTVGSVAAVAVVAGIVASFVFAPKPASYEAATGASIEGVADFEHKTEHVEGDVQYEQTPPAGGPHDIAWLTCAAYDEPQRDEHAVHSLEHGAVWITYDPAQVDDAEISTLRSYLPGSYALMSPYPDMDTPIAVSAWNHQLTVDDASDPRIARFFQEYWKSPNVPEPGASCTGIDGPGKL